MTDGKKFKVGSECVRKTNDVALISETERAEAKLKRHAKEAARITAAHAKLTDPTLQGVLSSLPHPYGYQAAKGHTRFDWAIWMMQNAGNKGKIDVARFLDKLPKLDIGTEERRNEETAKMASTKAQFNDKVLPEKQAHLLKLKKENAWVVNSLRPYSHSDFAYSVMQQLTYMSFRDLSPRQKDIVAEIIAKEAGRKGSNSYYQKYDEIRSKLNSEN